MKKVHRLQALLLLAVFAFGCVPLFVFGGEARLSYPGAEAAGSALDASKTGDESPEMIPAEEFFSVWCGVTLLDSERAYYENAGIAFRYSDAVPKEYVVTTHTENGVKIEAKEYRYTSASGIEVRFAPVSASVGETVKNFAGSSGTLLFEGLEGGQTYEAVVRYRIFAVLPERAVSDALNAAWKVGAEADGKLSAFESASAEYARRSKEYEALYAAYLAASNKYAQYLRDKEEYDRKRAAYDEYVGKKTAYEEQYAAYTAYLEAKSAFDAAYVKYEEDLAVYREAYKEYLACEAQKQACADALRVLSTVFIKDDAGNMMYNTLLGPTVDTVMKNKGTLERQGGVDPKDVQGAGDAADVLRALLPPYRKLKKLSEQFAYYAEHYTEIRDSFIKLYKHLNSLCKNSVVREVLAKEGKLERYYQFVAHLYLLSACFDDTSEFDPSWTIRGKTLQSLLSENLLIPDENNADPSGITYPETSVKEPVSPTEPEEPQAVSEPSKTWEIDLSLPVEPDTVAQPEDPGTLEDHAGEKPVKPLLSADQTALANDVRTGVLTQRAGRELTLSFESEVTRSVAYEGAVTVRFFDADRKTLLYTSTVLKGGDVHYGGATPKKDPDVRNSYTFAGFFDEEGNGFSLVHVERDADLFARYIASPIGYTVIFDVRGSETGRTCRYGDLPEAPDYPVSYTENGIEYRFEGFEPAITVVTGNARYTARYTPVIPERYTVVFDVDGVKTQTSVRAGELPEAPEVPAEHSDEYYVYAFIGWSPAIVRAEKDAAYTAVYEKKYIAPSVEGDGGARVVAGADGFAVLTGGAHDAFDVSGVFARALENRTGLTFSTGETTVYIPGESVAAFQTAKTVRFYPEEKGFFIALTDGEGADLFEKHSAEVRVGGAFAIGEGSVLKRLDGALEQEISFMEVDGMVSAVLPGGGSYRLLRTYTVTVSGGRAQASAARALPGERITVTANSGDGEAIGSLILHIDGETQRTVLGRSFDMPEGNVTVEPVFVADGVTFTVRFYDGNGEVLLTRQYRYGETLILPETAPEKRSDDPEYLYSFTGWEPTVIGRVVEDADYRPVFKKVQNADYVSPYDSDRFVGKVLLMQVLPVFILLVLAVSGPVIYVRLSKKRKKNI